MGSACPDDSIADFRVGAGSRIIGSTVQGKYSRASISLPFFSPGRTIRCMAGPSGSFRSCTAVTLTGALRLPLQASLCEVRRKDAATAVADDQERGTGGRQPFGG